MFGCMISTKTNQTSYKSQHSTFTEYLPITVEWTEYVRADYNISKIIGSIRINNLIFISHVTICFNENENFRTKSVIVNEDGTIHTYTCSVIAVVYKNCRFCCLAA